jgi:hypothetical protein
MEELQKQAPPGGGGGGPGGAGIAPAVLVFGLVAGAMGCLVIIAGVVVLVGQAMACTVPADSGGKGYIVGAVVCLVLGAVIQLGGSVAITIFAMNAARAGGAMGPPQIQQMQEEMRPMQMAIGFTAQALYAVHGLLFLQFLRQLARYFRREPLAANIGWLMVVAILFGVVGMTLGAVNMARMPADPQAQFAQLKEPMTVALSLINLTAMFGLGVWTLLVLRRTRNALPEI